MPRTSSRFGTWSTACGVILTAAAVLSAAPASADSVDDAFVAALANHGITVADRGSAIAMAHNICGGLDKGQASSVMAMRLVRETSLTAKQAGYFVGLSVSAYCPQYKGATDPSVIWMLPQFPMTQ